jgi:hypothetical protein
MGKDKKEYWIKEHFGLRILDLDNYNLLMNRENKTLDKIINEINSVGLEKMFEKFNNHGVGQ